MAKSLIRIENLSFSYPAAEGEENFFVLKNINLEISEGSFVAIAGRNGSGKSTLAKQINGLLLPTQGEVFVDGLSTKSETDIWDIRKCCGMVFQNPDNQLVSSVVEDDVAFGPENIGISPGEIRKRVDASLKAVDMYQYKDKSAHLLSGGQKQRVAIAGVLAMEPKCIVFDEPTAMLDPAGRQSILSIIEKLHAQGKTVILITHFMEEAEKADRIIVMDDGTVAMDGSPAEIFAQTDKLKALNLKPTFACQMAEELRAAGVAIGADMVNEAQLEKQIVKLYK